MRVKTTVTANAVFIQCYDNFEGYSELDSAKMLRDNTHNMCGSFDAKELEQNENGVYYFELCSRMEDINFYLRNYSKCDLIKYFDSVFTSRINKIQDWLKI